MRMSIRASSNVRVNYVTKCHVVAKICHVVVPFWVVLRDMILTWHRHNSKLTKETRKCKGNKHRSHPGTTLQWSDHAALLACFSDIAKQQWNRLRVTSKWDSLSIGLSWNTKPLSKICALEKVDQSSPNSLTICYAPMPLIVPNFLALGQTTYEKSVTIFFTPFSILALQGTPELKFIGLGNDVQQCPDYQQNRPNFVP